MGNRSSNESKSSNTKENVIASYWKAAAIIGEISVKSNHEIEWTIPEFLLYTKKDTIYDSPRFDVSGSQWYLKINPDGFSLYNSIGYVALYLFRKGGCSPVHQGAYYSFGIKRADGVVEQKGGNFTWVFTENDDGTGTNAFVRRSELRSRESELLPSGVITVTCSLWVKTNGKIFESTLSRDFLDMFTSKRGCDVTVKVKDKEFSVHKFVLVARTPSFATLFDEDELNAEDVVLNIGDCHPAIFKAFLTYLYSGKTEFLWKELASQESKLMSSGVFTVTCSLWANSNREISASKRTLSQDFLDMFTSKRGCDVTVKVKDNEFSVHKFVMVARSPVFAALFDEDELNTEGVVLNIEDCDPATFKDFLTYLYSGETDILYRDPIEVYKIASKYDVKELKSACLICIMCTLSTENVMEVSALAHVFSDTMMKLAVQRFINMNCGAIASVAGGKLFKE